MRSLALALLPFALAGCIPSGSPTSAPSANLKPAGKIKASQILNEYYDPAKNPNRAALADKYFGKYWEIDLTDEIARVEEEYIVITVAFFNKHNSRFYFRDKSDLLKFSFQGKGTGPRKIVGKAVSADEFQDCYIP